jgi:Thoeris protein ThsB, TIR-like domain
MARRVFFSFHYQNDIWKVNIIRNSHIVEGSAAAGFQDASIWEAAKTQGDDAVHRLINRGLENTSVTCVLIGTFTAQRKYVDYEIEQSIKRGNGLLGIHINNIGGINKGISGIFDSIPGTVPAGLIRHNAPVYTWDREKFGEWVEDAFQRSSNGITESIERLLGRPKQYGLY